MDMNVEKQSIKKTILSKAIEGNKLELFKHLNAESNIDELFVKAVTENKHQIAKYLYETHTDSVNIHFQSDYAILLSIMHNNLSMLQFFFSKGLKLDAYNSGGLKISIENGYDVISKYLIDNGVSSSRCLECCIKRDSLPIFKYIYQSNDYSVYINDILALCCQMERLLYIKYLHDAGVDVSVCVFYATMYNKIEIVQKIIEYGINVSLYIQEGIIIAKQSGYIDIYDYLIGLNYELDFDVSIV